jgi:hypothetical protein
MVGGSSHGRGWEFSPHHRLQTSSGGHSASYPMGTRGSLPRVRDRGVKMITHLHFVPMLEMRGAISPLPQYTFMAWCSVKAQGQFYLYLIREQTDITIPSLVPTFKPLFVNSKP